MHSYFGNELCGKGKYFLWKQIAFWACEKMPFILPLLNPLSSPLPEFPFSSWIRM